MHRSDDHRLRPGGPGQPPRIVAGRLHIARALAHAALTALFALVAAGPARAARQEVASFTSTPEPARVFIDGAYVGDTPLQLTFTCDQMGDRRYRIERDGCAPAEGILNARVAAGRIVGASFCFGINYAFQCTQYFVPVNVVLQCGDAAGAPGRPSAVPVAVDQLPPRVNLRKQPPPTPLSTQDMEAQLKSLKDLRQRGVITEAQYQQERERLLNALGY